MLPKCTHVEASADDDFLQVIDLKKSGSPSGWAGLFCVERAQGTIFSSGSMRNPLKIRLETPVLMETLLFPKENYH
jgi:hypothetical protein